MIFQHTWEKVLTGEKTQTRRLVKPNELLFSEFSETTPQRESVGRVSIRMLAGHPLPEFNTKWEVGKTYAVQPARTLKAVTRIRITEIQREPLQVITPEDARREGIPDDAAYPVRRYAALWDFINHQKGTRWADDPMVWVLSFELVKENEK